MGLHEVINIPSVLVKGVVLGVGGGKRRKRHLAISKIVQKLETEFQVMQHHVQAGVFHPCTAQLRRIATTLIDQLRTSER